MRCHDTDVRNLLTRGNKRPCSEVYRVAEPGQRRRLGSLAQTRRLNNWRPAVWLTRSSGHVPRDVWCQEISSGHGNFFPSKFSPLPELARARFLVSRCGIVGGRPDNCPWTMPTMALRGGASGAQSQALEWSGKSHAIRWQCSVAQQAGAWCCRLPQYRSGRASNRFLERTLGALS